MPAQDTSPTKEKIVSIIRNKGPSLPVHIAKEIESDILFTSAFLSELISEKRIKMSNMRIGSSPLYFVPGQEPLLEKFSHHLKSREKEAYNILKDKKILKDTDQSPPVRVALRAIKDFAIPFKKDDEVYWRFFTCKEEEAATTKKQPEKTQEKPKEKELDIFEKPKEAHSEKGGLGGAHSKKKAKRKPKKNGNSQKENIFFNKVKNYLNEKSIELIDILTVNKNEIILKIKSNNVEQVLIAYNKKKLNDNDIIKASKKAKELKQKYTVISNGGILKKTKELISAIKNLQTTGELKDNV